MDWMKEPAQPERDYTLVSAANAAEILRSGGNTLQKEEGEEEDEGDEDDEDERDGEDEKDEEDEEDHEIGAASVDTQERSINEPPYRPMVDCGR
ncbi:hypothetical protein B0A50_07819 [Salinomyces thailandicus]|uniref:Uncharacterized protein n=1 Tax=Salinomyces thailandicus TaxID=706561 RepID=A0A4U0TLR7_9PEZI|nr:hypothetical protein B0A50_07819 [Salinomyces thailandica]